jgi:hypothetical protein
VLLLVDYLPWARVPLGVESATELRVIVLAKTTAEIAGMPDVDLAFRVEQDVDGVVHRHTSHLAPRPGLEPGIHQPAD